MLRSAGYGRAFHSRCNRRMPGVFPEAVLPLASVPGSLAPRLHGRVEVGFGGYSLVGGGILCPAVYPSDCGGPGGFPELLTVSGGIVLGRISPSRGPFVTVGAAAIQGFGNEGRRDRRAITPDIGMGLATGRACFLELRYRALREWEGERFRQLGLGLGWRRP